jgi:hypothetical protein
LVVNFGAAFDSSSAVAVKNGVVAQGAGEKEVKIVVSSLLAQQIKSRWTQ